MYNHEKLKQILENQVPQIQKIMKKIRKIITFFKFEIRAEDFHAITFFVLEFIYQFSQLKSAITFNFETSFLALKVIYAKIEIKEQNIMIT